jgi:ribosomal protein S18 acetylase RimI-like enzyme
MNVASLSNYLRRCTSGHAGHNATTPPIHHRPAGGEEINVALGLIIGQPGQPADDRQLADFLGFARQRNVDLNDLWIVERGGKVLWAALPILSPGRTMLLFTPSEPVPADGAAAVTRLLDEVCTRFAARDIQLAQILLDPGDHLMRRIFEGRGFLRMAELIYLHAAVRRPLPPPALAPEFSILPYSPHTHDLFAAGIIASYQNSLDCPGLNGVRNIEDVIAGHKSSGDFDPQHWVVLCERDADARELPRGVLLLSRLPRGDTVELVYLGLAPQVRGRGLAEWMMRRAFNSAAAMGVGRLSLAVDSNNAPALKLYYRFGMARIGSKLAMMRKLL